ncbi:hypothetical protein MY1884_003648 [Beauveria asiatica]
MSTQASPKDSMKSTWLHGDRSRWKWSHRLLARQLAAHPEYDVGIPVHANTDPMPVVASWTPHVFVLLAYCGGGGADAATPLDVAADSELCAGNCLGGQLHHGPSKSIYQATRDI